LSARPVLAVAILFSFAHPAKVRRRWREQEIHAAVVGRRWFGNICLAGVM
jgi:hypothetical protein